MDSCNGKSLVQTFNNLGIDTGSVSKSTIEAWFDTDCEATKELLNWMCVNLNQDNVLTVHENEEYENCLKNKSLLHDKRYNDALEEIKTEFPDILEYEDNQFEIECMQYELESLQEKERDLKHTKSVSSNVQKLLVKKIEKATEEELECTLEREKMQNICQELSLHLDNLHQKLFNQIGRYVKHLAEFDHANKPVFLSNIPVNNHNQYISSIESYLRLLLNKNGCSNSTLMSARKNLQESFLIHEPDDLEIVWQRLYVSHKNLLHEQIREEELKAEIDFVKNITINDLLLSSSDFSAQFMLEANNLSKEALLNHLLQEADNSLRQKTDMLVNGPKITAIQKDVAYKKKEFELVQEQNSKVDKILSLQKILDLLYKAEGTDIKNSEDFFCQAYNYIAQDLARSSTRQDLMSKVIEDYRIYRDLPFERQFKLFQWMKSFLDNGTGLSLIDMLKKFEHSYKNVELRVFVDDYKQQREFAKKFSSQLKVMKKFLINEPTSQILVLSNQAAQDLHKNSELLKSYKNLIFSALEMKKTAEKRVENDKWFKLKRQLWMFFLTDPQMVVQITKQIATAVQEARRAIK